jgi:hypothetical protein
VCALLLAGDLAGQVINFTNNHTITFQSPFQAPVVLKAKASTQPVHVVQPVIYLDEKTELKDYVCSKKWDCATAYAIMMAESHGNAEALNANANHTVDLGCMQVNSIHLVKGIKPSDLLNCHTNIDVAYQIYQSWGNSFKAWSTYNSGAYKRYLNSINQ